MTTQAKYNIKKLQSANVCMSVMHVFFILFFLLEQLWMRRVLKGFLLILFFGVEGAWDGIVFQKAGRSQVIQPGSRYFKKFQKIRNKF